MKWYYILLIFVMGVGSLFAQDPAKARTAAQAMEPAILRGDLTPLLEKMHPRWKERLAKRNGGEEKLAAAFRESAKKIAAAGVQVVSFAVSPATAKPVPVYFDRERLVFLPTTKMISGLDKEGKLRTIEQTGYLIAVAKTGTDDWSFIDGQTVSKADIRSLFPELKKEFVVPKSGTKVVE